MSQLNPAETLRCYFIKIHLNSAVASSLTYLTYSLCVLQVAPTCALKVCNEQSELLKHSLPTQFFPPSPTPYCALSTLSHKPSVRNLPLPCKLKFHTTAKTGNKEFSLLQSFSLLHRTRTSKSFKTRKQVRFQKFSFVSDFSLI